MVYGVLCVVLQCCIVCIIRSRTKQLHWMWPKCIVKGRYCTVVLCIQTTYNRCHFAACDLKHHIEVYVISSHPFFACGYEEGCIHSWSERGERSLTKNTACPTFQSTTWYASEFECNRRKEVCELLTQHIKNVS